MAVTECVSENISFNIAGIKRINVVAVGIEAIATIALKGQASIGALNVGANGFDTNIISCFLARAKKVAPAFP